MSEAVWFLRVGEEVIGPFTRDETERWIKSTTGGLDVTVSRDQEVWVSAEGWLEAVKAGSSARERRPTEANAALPPPVVQQLYAVDRFTKWCAIALFLGVFLPWVRDSFGETAWRWVFDNFDRTWESARRMVELLLFPVGGISFLLVLRGRPGAMRSGALLGIAVMVWLIATEFGPWGRALRFPRGPIDVFGFVVLVPIPFFLLTLVAAASRLRLRDSGNAGLRACAGLGGLGVLLILLIPMRQDEPLVFWLFEGRAWEGDYWMASASLAIITVYTLLAATLTFTRTSGGGRAAALALVPLIWLPAMLILIMIERIGDLEDAPLWIPAWNVIRHLLPFCALILLTYAGWYRLLLSAMYSGSRDREALEDTFA